MRRGPDGRKRGSSKASGEGRFKARPAEIAKRASRNAARASLKAALGTAAVHGKEVEHKDGNPLIALEGPAVGRSVA